VFPRLEREEKNIGKAEGPQEESIMPHHSLVGHLLDIIHAGVLSKALSQVLMSLKNLDPLDAPS